KDCSFYASLRTKPALIENNTIKDNENGDSNAITIANNEVDMDKEFSELDDQEVDFDGSSFNDFCKKLKTIIRSVAHNYELHLISLLNDTKLPNNNQLVVKLPFFMIIDITWIPWHELKVEQ
ncbi:14061_t:CDS:2, partial [Gigaspora rosea]